MYGQLPSVVRDTATTYDMAVTQLLLEWEKEQYDQAQGKPATPKLTVEEMQAMMARVRSEGK